MSTAGSVGVLALQGDFSLHLRALGRAGAAARPVRSAVDLEGLSALVIPGGESTTMLHLMAGTGLEEAIVAFAGKGRPLLGTCAGLILLAREVTNPVQGSLGLLDVSVARNAFGRQVDSFETDLALVDGSRVRGVFIRAPRITDFGDGVEVLAWLNGEPVFVRQGRIFASTFHPELTDDLRLHQQFLAVVNASDREE